jgi:hypothetical protein
MRSLMDRVEIQSEQRHTLVRLVKNVEREMCVSPLQSGNSP